MRDLYHDFKQLGQRNRDGLFQTQHDRENILTLVANKLTDRGGRPPADRPRSSRAPAQMAVDREVRLAVSRQLGHEGEQVTAATLAGSR